MMLAAVMVLGVVAGGLALPHHTSALVLKTVAIPQYDAEYNAGLRAQAREDWLNSESSAALDRAGASLFSALGNVATAIGNIFSGTSNRHQQYSRPAPVYTPDPVPAPVYTPDPVPAPLAPLAPIDSGSHSTGFTYTKTFGIDLPGIVH